MIQIASASHRVRVDYLKGIDGNRLHELFNENKVMGMVEAFNNDHVNKDSSFIGALVDQL